MLCDTLDNASNCISIFPSGTLIFPNLLSKDFLNRVYEFVDPECYRIYYGYKYLLLDRFTLIPKQQTAITKDNSDLFICNVSFGFSAFEFNDSQLLHLSRCCSSIIKAFPRLKFILIGSNALDLFNRLDISSAHL